MSTKYRLVFAFGPTPADPMAARLLGAEEVTLAQKIGESDQRFAMYCHAASIPELVAYARTLGRDCSYSAFAETQALLTVHEATQ